MPGVRVLADCHALRGGGGGGALVEPSRVCASGGVSTSKEWAGAYTSSSCRSRSGTALVPVQSTSFAGRDSIAATLPCSAAGD